MLPDGICHLFCRRTVGQRNDLIQLLTNRQRLRQHKSSRRRPSRPGRPCSPALVFPAERAQARVPPKRTTPATSLGDDHQSMLGRSSAAGGIRRGGCTRFGGPRMSAFCPPCRRPWRNRAQPRRLGGTLPQGESAAVAADPLPPTAPRPLRTPHGRRRGRDGRPPPARRTPAAARAHPCGRTRSPPPTDRRRVCPCCAPSSTHPPEGAGLGAAEARGGHMWAALRRIPSIFSSSPSPRPPSGMAPPPLTARSTEAEVAHAVTEVMAAEFDAAVAARVGGCLRAERITGRVFVSLTRDDVAELFPDLAWGARRTLWLLVQAAARPVPPPAAVAAGPPSGGVVGPAGGGGGGSAASRQAPTPASSGLGAPVAAASAAEGVGPVTGSSVPPALASAPAPAPLPLELPSAASPPLPLASSPPPAASLSAPSSPPPVVSLPPPAVSLPPPAPPPAPLPSRPASAALPPPPPTASLAASAAAPAGAAPDSSARPSAALCTRSGIGAGAGQPGVSMDMDSDERADSERSGSSVGSGAEDGLPGTSTDMDSEERADSEQSGSSVWSGAEDGLPGTSTDMDLEERADSEQSDSSSGPEVGLTLTEACDVVGTGLEESRALVPKSAFTLVPSEAAGAGSTTKRPLPPSPDTAAKRARTGPGGASGGVEDDFIPLCSTPTVPVSAADPAAAAAAVDEPPPPAPSPLPPPPDFLLGICGPTGAGKSTACRRPRLLFPKRACSPPPLKTAPVVSAYSRRRPPTVRPVNRPVPRGGGKVGGSRPGGPI